MDIYAESHIGMVRRENQDSYHVMQVREGVILALVCDGMGGVAGGKLASSLAAEQFAEHFGDSYRSLVGDKPSSDELLHRIFSHAVYYANMAVFEESVTDPTLEGMGTTLTAVCIADGRAYIANIGDSRTYLYTGGDITRLTHDDSLVQALLDSGEMEEEEAWGEDVKNILTRALGTDPYVDFSFSSVSLPEGCSLLLCSDGLTAHFRDVAIADILSLGHTAREAVSLLITSACAAGGKDNITCICLKNIR